MAYEPKDGEGTLFENKQARDNERAPPFKGYLILPDGKIVGVSMWKQKTQKGTMLSMKCDDREGAYWADKFSRDQVEGGGDRREDRRDDRRASSRDRDDDRGQRRWDDRGRSRHDDRRDDRRRGQRDDDGFTSDLDDEIPF